MPNFLLLATAWGPKFGGINAFNTDFAKGLAAHLGADGRVFCAVFNPTREDRIRSNPYSANQSGANQLPANQVGAF